MTYRELMAYTITFLAVFRVHPSAGGTFLSVFLHDAILIVILPLMALLIRADMRHVQKPRILLAFLSLSILAISSTVSASFLGHGTYTLRVAYYLIIYILIYGIFTKYNISIREVGKAVNLIIICNFAVVLVQLAEPPMVYDATLYIFGDEKLKGFDFISPRVFGVFFNVNWAGVVYSMFLIVLLAQYKNGYISKYRVYILVSFIFISLLMTGSRTGLLVFIGTFLLWLSLNGRMGGAAFIGVVIGIGVTLVHIYGSFNLGRFAEVVNLAFSEGGLATIHSVSERGKTMETGMELFLARPVTGWGEVEHVFHNSWITALVSFGIIGFILMFVVIVNLLVEHLKGRENRVSVICITAPIFVSSFTGEYIFVTQVMVAYIICITSLRYNNFSDKMEY